MCMNRCACLYTYMHTITAVEREARNLKEIREWYMGRGSWRKEREGRNGIIL